MINTLVFGKNGQLGRSLAAFSAQFPETTVQFLDRRACDLSKPAKITALIDLYRPDVIINAAAYTAVDQAENEPDLAHKINCDAVQTMAERAADLSIPLIHVSTDYVFGGQAEKPYRETDTVVPLGVYGATKLAGEEAVRAISDKHLILRTSWVYSPFGKNFVKTMLRLLSEKTEIGVVDDQQGCPTSALDLATGILRILPDVTRGDFAQFGTYHLVSDTQMTWWAFAREIQSKATELLGTEWSGASCEIKAVTSAQFPTVAQRPAYSVMSTEKFMTHFGFGLPTFDRSLSAVLQKLAGEA